MKIDRKSFRFVNETIKDSILANFSRRGCRKGNQIKGK